MEKIITGVKQNNRVGFLDDDFVNGIDMSHISAMEDHVTGCEDIKCKTKNHEPFEEELQSDSPDILVGFKQCFKEKEAHFWFRHLGYGYKMDEEADYSAIINGDPHYTTQVLRSKYVSLCNKCSPCYPGQGDLDTHGSLVAYALPPECYDKEFDNPLPIIPIDLKVKIWKDTIKRSKNHNTPTDPEEEGLLFEFLEKHYLDFPKENITLIIKNLQSDGRVIYFTEKYKYLILTSE